MLWLISLFAAFALAQNCNVDSINNASRKRRECKDRDGCKWNGSKTVNGNVVPGTCTGSSSCESQSINQCRKFNKCFVDWTVAPQNRKCSSFNPSGTYSCPQLAGKVNMKLCKAYNGCMNGSGDRENKQCLPIPDDLDNQDCNNFSGRPNKYLCQTHKKCEWTNKNKKCLDKATIVKTCTTIGDRQACEKNHSGCKWVQGAVTKCQASTCSEIVDRTMCNMSKRGCQWYQGFNPDDFDHTKNKAEQKDDPKNAGKFNAEGTCRNGVKNCGEILVKNNCMLAQLKYGINGCKWNDEAKEIDGANRCSNRAPCSTHLNSAVCLTSNNMLGGNCVWQKSGAAMRCMEFACDSNSVNTKNKCNTVGCHWHRNKDKRDPESKGYCDIYDLAKGRRL